MSAATARTAEPSVASGSKHSSRSSSHSVSRPPSSARSSNQDLLERIHEAETRSQGYRSHAGTLVPADSHSHTGTRSMEDIYAEIAALEAEAEAQELRRRPQAVRNFAIRDRRRRRSGDDYEIVEEERRVYRRPTRDYVRDDRVVLFDRTRSLPPARDEYVVYERPRSPVRDEYVIYERPKSPARDAVRDVVRDAARDVRVQKDRKGKLAFVRSSKRKETGSV